MSYLDTTRNAEPVFLVDGSGSPYVSGAVANVGVQLAGVPLGAGTTLAAGASTPAQAVIYGQSYIWSYQFSGTTTLILESLGPDGVTFSAFTPAASATASGQQGVTTGANPGGSANVRIRNTGANAATNLFSSLS